jgi:hypothetical protein
MATDTNGELVEAETRPDLVWDDEVRGLCLRVHRDWKPARRKRVSLNAAQFGAAATHGNK